MQRWLARLLGIAAFVLFGIGAYLVVCPVRAPVAVLAVEPTELDIGALAVGTTRVIEFRISNSGDRPGRVVGLTRF